MKKIKKAIIYVPGLNDLAFLNKTLISFLPIIWSKYGFEIYVIYPHWKEGKSFQPKLKQILDKIDELDKKGYMVYLIGQSAGGSAVLSAFVARKTKVTKAVNVCGRLRKGENVFPSLDTASKGNPAFKDSVLLFENQNEKKLSKKDREKILTIRPFFDEIVPFSTVALEGAMNIVIPMIEHSLSGICALTIFSGRIRNFL